MITLNPQHTALICVDFQASAFLGGDLTVVGAAEVLPRAKRVQQAARVAGMPLIHLQEVHRKEMVDFGRELDGAEPVHLLETWPNTQIYSELAPLDGEFVITKRRYSGFFGTDLEILLKGLKVDRVVLMGGMTNVCVHYTAVDAHQRDYFFHVIEDCCVGSDWAAHDAALTAMAYLQRESRILHTDFIEACGIDQSRAELMSAPLHIQPSQGNGT